MRPFCVFVVALLLTAGCAAQGEKSQWDDFWKDLRGDNQQMRGWSSPHGDPGDK